MSTSPLSARSTLGPRGLTGGSIAGAVVGSVVGALLIALCIIPFLVRARRRRATRHGDAAIQAEEGQSQSPGGRSSPPQTDESKRLSSDVALGYSPGVEPTGHLNGHHHPNGINGHDLYQKAPHSPSHLPPAVDTEAQGISSSASPPLSPTSKPDPRAQVQGQAYPTPPPDDPVPLSTTYRGRESTRELSLTDSYGPPSRELTGGITHSGITEEPESFEQSSAPSPSHRHFSQISGSIRSLIRKRYSEHRRDSRRDSRRSTTDGARSPSIITTDPLTTQPEPVQSTFEEADINARGEAWSYYNDPDLIPPAQDYVPTTSAPLTAVPPTHAPVSAPLSPVSLPDHPVVLGEAATRPMIAQSVVEEPDLISPGSEKTVTPARYFGRTSTLRGPGSLTRTDSLPPLQPIVADLENYPVPYATSTSPSARPMDMMRPTNEAESAWRVHQEILKIESPSPDPEPALEYMDPVDQQHYQIKSNPSPETDYHSPPNIAINDHEFNFTDMIVEDPDQQEPYYFTPPPSSGPSNQNTPDTHISEYTTSPSPRSDVAPAPSVQSESSPRLFPCDQCNRVFDQVHKLNHHRRYHERPHECTHPGCTMRFGTKTHLDRHINDKHNKTRKFHCTVHDCPYSRQGGKSFPRKDNWRRHMMNKHRITPDTDPVEYAEDPMMLT